MLTVGTSLLESPPSSNLGGTSEKARPSHTAFDLFKPESEIILEHAGLYSGINAFGTAIGIGAHTRALPLGSFTCGEVFLDAFATLSRGGCVFLPSEGHTISLSRSIKAMEVNQVTLTPTALAKTLRPCDVPIVDTLILMGEATRSAVVEAWASHANISNAYCPLQGAVFAAYAGPITKRGHSSFFGSPEAARMWVTGRGDCLCPIGAPGELLIEGSLLPRVCIDDGADSSVLIKDLPFMKEAGLDSARRMYRTGDIVRQNHDSSLSYLGRKAEKYKSLVRVSTRARLNTGSLNYYLTLSWRWPI